MNISANEVISYTGRSNASRATKIALDANLENSIAVIGLPLLSFKTRKYMKHVTPQLSFFKNFFQLKSDQLGEYSIIIVDKHAAHKYEQLEDFNRSIKNTNSNATIILLSDVVNSPLIFDDLITQRIADAIIPMPESAYDFQNSIYTVVNSIRQRNELGRLDSSDQGSFDKAA